MGKSGITLKLEGFEELLKEIEKAGGTMESAARSCMDKSVPIVEQELKKQMSSSGVDIGLISRMPAPTITQEGNTFRAEVGYNKGNYDPENPSDGYKVAFLNYGTPKGRTVKKENQHISVDGQWKTATTNRGTLPALGFIAKAKKAAQSKVKKVQKETLNEILGGLKK